MYNENKNTENALQNVLIDYDGCNIAEYDTK